MAAGTQLSQLMSGKLFTQGDDKKKKKQEEKKERER